MQVGGEGQSVAEFVGYVLAHPVVAIVCCGDAGVGVAEHKSCATIAAVGRVHAGSASDGAKLAE